MKLSFLKKNKDNAASPGILSTNTRNQRNPYHILGLTGGIASGKSTAARFFEEAGIPVVDADQISRDISQKGGVAYEPIMQRFGTIDRLALRKIIFTDQKARQDLEAILHPLIAAESMSRMARLESPVIIYEAALLVETGGYRDFDGLIVVDAPSELRKQRLCSRDKIELALAEQIFASQTSDEERRSHATYILDNSGSKDNLRRAVIALAKKILGEYGFV